jgi:hypothetical protein
LPALAKYATPIMQGIPRCERASSPESPLVQVAGSAAWNPQGRQWEVPGGKLFLDGPFKRSNQRKQQLVCVVCVVRCDGGDALHAMQRKPGAVWMNHGSSPRECVASVEPSHQCVVQTCKASKNVRSGGQGGVVLLITWTEHNVAVLRSWTLYYVVAQQPGPLASRPCRQPNEGFREGNVTWNTW